tara:strand:- start:194 stop:661 length:468 start_codon:yes stop_codon:yes gene_type:complete
MNTFFKAVTIVLALAITSCATIISGSRQEVLINSNPKQALVSINEIEMGQTPIQKKLKRNQEYNVVLKLDGYTPYRTTLKKKFNAWYLGNIVIGGIIGLVVDPITGAMYKLKPEEIDGRPQQGSTYRTDNGTLYLTISMEVDPNWEKVGQLERSE